MNIGVDISQIVYEGTGVSRFTRGLIESILKYDAGNKWTFFFSGFRKRIDSELGKAIRDSGHILLEWKLPPRALSLLWNDFHTLEVYPPPLLQLDWFITSDWTEPKLPGVKKATIVHDLVFKRFPETVEQTILGTQTRRLDWVVKESNMIFADSLATENDIRNYYGVKDDRIIVNYPGVEVDPPTNPQKPKRPFILTVGKFEPRKNLTRLVNAFSRIGDENVDLVIVGPQGWAEIGDEFKNKNIKLLNYVSDRELYSLYSTCLFFVYPSIWEGFGIPVIEAMKLGVPVTCSNTSSVAEIAGDAALLFNPENEDDILKSLLRLKGSQSMRNTLSARGVEVAAKFTWRSYYDKMMKSMLKH